MLTKLAAVPLAASLALFSITGWAHVTGSSGDDSHPAESGTLLEVAEPEPISTLAPGLSAEFAAAADPQSAATVVAEPGTWALLGVGILGLSLARRRLANSSQTDVEQPAAEPKQTR